MKLLLADADFISRKLFGKRLSAQGYQVTAVANGLEAWEVLQRPDAPQIAILDWDMPGRTGLELCRAVRERKAESYVYLVLLTARTEHESLLAGFDAGADDYVRKPVDPTELEARLRTARRIVDLEERLRRARDAFEVQATYDPLTRTFNRRAILDRLGSELARGERGQGAPSVVLVDVDHFKSINDTHGHAGGDAVLSALVPRLSAVLRPYDAVGRYGGEEFLVLLPSCTGTAALAIAERLRAAVAAKPFDVAGQDLAVTSSFGVAEAAAGATADALIEVADRALYGAKRAGRNRVELGVLGG